LILLFKDCFIYQVDFVVLNDFHISQVIQAHRVNLHYFLLFFA